MNVIMEEGEQSHQDLEVEATDNEEHENGNTSIISRSFSVSASVASSVGVIQEVTEAPNSDRNESDQQDFHVGDVSSRSRCTKSGVAAAIRAPEDHPSSKVQIMPMSSAAQARMDMDAKLKASLRAKARKAGVGAFHVVPPAGLESDEETKEEEEEIVISTDHTNAIDFGTISTTSDGDDALVYKVLATPVLDQDMILATPVKKVKNKKKKIGVAVLIFISFIIAVIVTTARNRPGPGSTRDNAFSSSPTPSPTVNSDELQSQLEAFSTVKDLERIGSPQRSALMWIANRDRSGIEYTDTLFYQRYALIVLYYATQPDTFASLDVWVDTTKHECDWGRAISCITDSTGMRRLTNIDLAKKRLQGTLPTEIGLLKDLEELSLSENELGSTIPEEIGKLTLLMRLDISKNNISGIIPDTIRSIEGLNYLILSQNRLTGQYPDAVHNLMALKTMDLSTNQLSGTMSYVPNTLAFLSTLNLRDNKFNGTIPIDFLSLPDLSILNLDFNDFSGNFIDLDITSFLRLEEVTLSHNRFTGSIPDQELDSGFDVDFLRLKKLDFSHNLFSGTVPPLGYVPNLKYVDLSSNKFTGTLSFTIAYLDNLEVFRSSDNLLTGQLIQFPVNIKHLDIKGNALTGEVFDSRLLKLQSLGTSTQRFAQIYK